MELIASPAPLISITSAEGDVVEYVDEADGVAKVGEHEPHIQKAITRLAVPSQQRWWGSSPPLQAASSPPHICELILSPMIPPWLPH
jgi:hypothetical protein